MYIYATKVAILSNILLLKGVKYYKTILFVSRVSKKADDSMRNRNTILMLFRI
jgi:hypothetical protein